MDETARSDSVRDGVDRAYALVLYLLEGRGDEAALMDSMTNESQRYNLSRAAVALAAEFATAAYGDGAAEHIRHLQGRRAAEGREG